MIGNVFESYCWNWDIGNWFDFLSSKRTFFRFFLRLFIILACFLSFFEYKRRGLSFF